MGQESSSPPSVFFAVFFGMRVGRRHWAEAVPGFFCAQGDGARRVTRAENSYEIRIDAHEMRQPSRPNPTLVGLRMTPCETKPRLDLGDLGAAHGNAMRRRTIEFDHRAVTLLANEADMRDRHDMTAVHP